MFKINKYMFIFAIYIRTKNNKTFLEADKQIDGNIILLHYRYKIYVKKTTAVLLLYL